jgi:hypothetical protein
MAPNFGPQNSIFEHLEPKMGPKLGPEMGPVLRPRNGPPFWFLLNNLVGDPKWGPILGPEIGPISGPPKTTPFWISSHQGQSLAQKLDLSLVPKKESLEPGMDPKAFAAPEKWNSC